MGGAGPAAMKGASWGCFPLPWAQPPGAAGHPALTKQRVHGPLPACPSPGTSSTRRLDVGGSPNSHPPVSCSPCRGIAGWMHGGAQTTHPSPPGSQQHPAQPGAASPGCWSSEPRSRFIPRCCSLQLVQNQPLRPPAHWGTPATSGRRCSGPAVPGRMVSLPPGCSHCRRARGRCGGSSGIFSLGGRCCSPGPGCFSPSGCKACMIPRPEPTPRRAGGWGPAWRREAETGGFILV